MFVRLWPRTWWGRCLLIVVTYTVAADLLPNALLVLMSAVGYLPYSDRPGPSWHPPHIPTRGEIDFFASFAFRLLPPTAIYGSIFALAALVLGFCRLPRWCLRLVATPFAFVASGLMAAAWGWYIALSATGTGMAAACGALWGFFVFPRLVPAMSYVPPNAVRFMASGLLLTGAGYALIAPLLPDPGLTNAKIEIVRRDDAGTDLRAVDLTYLGSSIATGVRGVGRYRSVNRMEFATNSQNQVRVLLIIDDSFVMPHTFPIPRSGDAVYRQSNGAWKQERDTARDSKLSLQLDSNGSDGITLRTTGPCCSGMTQDIAPYR